MSILSRLFGKSGKPAPAPAEAEVYKDFRIIPEPMKDGSQFRVAARIEKEVDGALKEHHLIRADTMAGLDQAKEASVAKAKQMIDEQGERLFKT